MRPDRLVLLAVVLSLGLAAAGVTTHALGGPTALALVLVGAASAIRPLAVVVHRRRGASAGPIG